MSNFGGKYSLFEKDFNERFEKLRTKLKKIDDELLSILSNSLKEPKVSTAYWNKVQTDIDVQYAKMIGVFDNWAEKEIPLSYRRSLRAMSKRINASKIIINTAKKNTIEMLHTQGSAQVMGLLYNNALDDFVSSVVAGRKNVRRFTRLTQQKLISEKLIDVELSSIFMETGDLGRSISGLSSRLWNESAIELEGRRFVQAGARKYTTEYYAEMVARVKFHEAQSEAALMTASNYDTDLLQVSSHNTTTTVCLDFEGKVFSISGKDLRFPPLREVSPYHVNCLHLMSPTFEGAMKIQGTLDTFSAFSKGDIPSPPVPAGFIPISKRSIS